MFVFLKFFRSKKSPHTKEDLEPQEVMLDGLAKLREEEMGVSEKRLEVPLSRYALRFFCLTVSVLFLALFIRSFQLQVIEGGNLSSIAERNRSAVFSIQALRGVVYDQEGNLLVTNSSRFDLYLNKNENCQESINQVAEILGVKKEELDKKIKNSENSTVLIERELDHIKLVLLEARIDNLSGFFIERTLDRDYKYGETLSHIMGYIGRVNKKIIEENPEKYSLNDYIGVGGIEKEYEDILARKKGKVFIERDALGNVKHKEVVSFPEAGNNLVLWIDLELQEKIEEEAFKILEETGSTKAAIVAMDPQNGGVLSTVSIPSYDNNLFNKKDNQELLSELLSSTDGVFLNRVLSSAYPPGSVIKPFIAAAALEEQIITPDRKIYSRGYITIPNPWNPSLPSIYRDNQAHGWTNVREAIAVSSNVYFYSIGGGYENQKGLGVEKIKEYLELFGWGSVTGIDLPGEKEGLIPNIQWKRDNIGATWTVGDTYNTSIGQGYISATPLQVAVSYASLINGGKLLSPSLLKEIRDDKGSLVKEISTEIVRENFISPETLKEIKEGMYQTTVIGTARSLGTLPVKVGAKTGTAQTSKDGYYHNWITAFAPFDDPEIVITVIIENVEGIQPATIPLARNVLDWYFKEK